MAVRNNDGSCALVGMALVIERGLTCTNKCMDVYEFRGMWGCGGEGAYSGVFWCVLVYSGVLLSSCISAFVLTAKGLKIRDV